MTELPHAISRPVPRSLADRANEALLALADRADREKTEAELNAITAACTRAETLRDSMVTCTRVGAELASRGVGHVQSSIPETVAKAITNLRKTATLAANPGVDLTDRLSAGAVQQALKAAETTVKLLEQALKRAADEERKRLTPSDLDRPIVTMPGHESSQVRIRAIKLSFSRPFAGPIQDLPSFIDEWRTLAAQWNDLRDETNQQLTELPPEIKAFVEATTSENGAPWSLVTAVVREWLDADGHGDGYGVHKW